MSITRMAGFNKFGVIVSAQERAIEDVTVANVPWDSISSAFTASSTVTGVVMVTGNAPAPFIEHRGKIVTLQKAEDVSIAVSGVLKSVLTDAQNDFALVDLNIGDSPVRVGSSPIAALSGHEGSVITRIQPQGGNDIVVNSIADIEDNWDETTTHVFVRPAAIAVTSTTTMQESWKPYTYTSITTSDTYQYSELHFEDFEIDSTTGQSLALGYVRVKFAHMQTVAGSQLVGDGVDYVVTGVATDSGSQETV